MKPITDDYDYLLFYKLATATGFYKSSYWATYGPVWSDTVGGLPENKDFIVRVRLTCSHNSSITSQYSQDYTKTLKKRKYFL